MRKKYLFWRHTVCVAKSFNLILMFNTSFRPQSPQFEGNVVVPSLPCDSQDQETEEKLSPRLHDEDFNKRPLTPPLPEFSESEAGAGYSPGPGLSSLVDVAGAVCLPDYQDQDNSLPLSLYKVTEVDYLASADHPDHCDPASVAGDCRVPVYEVSDPRLDLTTGQVHIHIVTSEPSGDQCEVLNLSSDLSGDQGDTDPVLTSYYDMSSTVTMDESEAASAHSSYPYFNGGAGAGASVGSGSSSSSPYGLSNRAYSDPASAYNLYSQYYGAAYPYGMNFGGSGSSSSTSGFTTKGEYGSSYYGSYASWTGNPYR